MAALFSFSIKQQDGSYKNFTGQISDETNKFGQNVTIWNEQTKEQRDAKEKKNYIANGKVFWTDGNIQVAAKKQNREIETIEPIDLPF